MATLVIHASVTGPGSSMARVATQILIFDHLMQSVNPNITKTALKRCSSRNHTSKWPDSQVQKLKNTGEISASYLFPSSHAPGTLHKIPSMESMEVFSLPNITREFSMGKAHTQLTHQTTCVRIFYDDIVMLTRHELYISPHQKTLPNHLLCSSNDQS